MVRFGVVAGVALVILTGCIPSPVQPAPAETIDYNLPPQWNENEDVGETRVSFARGVELVPGSRVEFRSRLGGVYDWESVGTPTQELTELVNANAGCHVRDETSVYVGEADDETASQALILAVLGEAEILGGPQRSVAGIGEGLGEGAPMYDVMHALAADPAGGYVYVTGRVFAALGVQHAITVRCELGGYLERTRAQIATTTWVNLDLPEDISPPAVTARPCTSDDLTIWFEPFDPSASEIAGLLHLRHDSAEACSISGYPVVYFASPESGETWGPPAAPDPSLEVIARDVPTGWEALARLTITRAETVCAEAVRTDALVVAPPTDAFDPATDGRRVPIGGLAVCIDATVPLLTVGGLQV